MPVTTPPQEAIDQFLGPTTRHVRRVEIYEADGVTRWAKDTVGRLKDGSVTVDYDRDERRALDLTLDNADDVLIHAPGEFWYDKILKVYRGVAVNSKQRLPKILIIADSTTDSHAAAFREAVASLGYGDVQTNVIASDYALDIAPYDIIVGLGGSNDQSALMVSALRNGKSVFVFRDSAQRLYDAAFGTTGWTKASKVATTAGTIITPANVSDIRTLGWRAFDPTADAISTAYNAPIAITAAGDTSLFGVGYSDTGLTSFAISSFSSSTFGKAMAVHYPLKSTQYMETDFYNFLRGALSWLNTVQPITVWETQIGEFMIDRISQANFPHEVKITGRDYTKKCIQSKFAQATMFVAGQSLEGLIGVLAANAGINKMALPKTGVVIGDTFTFDRNTSRWDAMKQIATAYNYEIFFDPAGYLVIRPFLDPTTSAPIIWIETGKQGQIATYTKSTSDANLFNHILVTGESSDANVLPVYSEAINTDPNSPTNVDEIGDRYWEYSSPLITTQQQADDLANTYLSIQSLESFELDFDTLIMPWLEAGDILGWIDPNPAPGDPNTFLLSSFTLPLGLAAMSGIGKRVLIVGM